MKTLRKLLAGTVLVALAAFGLTALTSSSTNSAYNTQVWAFLNETCTSEIAVLLESVADMLKLRGQEREGIIMDFKSYYHVSDLHQAEPKCNLVSELLKLPEVRVVKPRPKIIPADPPPGGGGGGEKPPAKKKTEVEFDSQDAQELKNCLVNKLEDLGKNLKGVTEILDEDELENLGCFVKMGLNNLTFKKTDYRWGASLKRRGLLGATTYITGQEKYDKSVVLYTNSINDKVKKFSYRNMSFENLSSNVGLDEMAHTIQGHNSMLADDTWKNPRPYEKYNLQLQANVYAYIWYKQLHSNNEPPIEMYDTDTINKWRDKDCNLKENSKFAKKKK